MSKRLKEMNILRNILAECLDLEISGGQRDGEGAVDREEVLSVKLDPQFPRERFFRVANGAVRRNRRRHWSSR